MMRIVLVACVVVAAVSAEYCCSHADQESVKKGWNALWNTPDSSTPKLIFGKELFSRFMASNPETVEIFTRVQGSDIDSADFKTHMLRVLGGLNLLINLLGNDDAFEAERTHLNEQHLARPGVTVAQFDSIAEIMVEILPQVLDQFDGISFRNCLLQATTGISNGLP